MKIALAGDHAGYELKSFLKAQLLAVGHEVVDCGCHSTERVYYGKFTLTAVSQLTEGRCERGIVVCGNGFATAMVANRVPGIKAAVCHDAFSARTTVEMGNANVLSLGARVVGHSFAWELTQIWLNSRFRGHLVPRYARREEKLKEIEHFLARPDWRAGLHNYLERERVEIGD